MVPSGFQSSYLFWNFPSPFNPSTSGEVTSSPRSQIVPDFLRATNTFHSPGHRMGSRLDLWPKPVYSSDSQDSCPENPCHSLSLWQFFGKYSLLQAVGSFLQAQDQPVSVQNETALQEVQQGDTDTPSWVTLLGHWIIPYQSPPVSGLTCTQIWKIHFLKCKQVFYYLPYKED
jgi:hypothetical protein